MKPILDAVRAPRGLTLGALVACGILLLAAAIPARRMGPAGPANAEFVVKSANDAGPGTLRDALLACDRLTSHCRILLEARQVVIESPLPALINPRGIEIEATGQAGTIDASRETQGPAIEIKSARSVLTGIHVVDARRYGILVDAPGAELTSVTVKDSKVGVMLGADASGTTMRTSLLEHDETGLMAETGVRDVGLVSDIFRLNTRAGLWFVGAPEARGGNAGDAAQEAPRLRVIDTVFESNAAGAVLANKGTLLQKDRFIDNQAALNVIGGAASVEDSEIRGSDGTAASVISARSVVLARNMLVNNKAAALIVRDSGIRIEGNTVAHNGLGLVLIGGAGAFTPVVKDNRITDTAADAITLIGGTALLQSNQVIGNRGAGLRPLDLVQGTESLKADPRLDHNVFHANGVDVAPTGVYRLKGGP